LENLDDNDDEDDDVDMSCAWESITENKTASTTESLGYYKLKQHKAWSDDVCS